MKNLRSLVVLSFLSLGLSACGTMPKNFPDTIAQNPIQVEPKSIPPVSVSKLNMGIKAGTTIGHMYSLFGIPTFKIYAKSFIDPFYEKMFSEELQKAGYEVKGMGTFREADLGEARFLIGGELLKAKVNTHAFLGNYMDAHYVIRWQVFDSKTKKIIYESQTAGGSVNRGIKSYGDIEAFRVAFKNFLADEKFIQTLKAVA